MNRQLDSDRLLEAHRHQVKNIFANVLAAVNQAQRSDDDPEVVLATLSDRITSLSRTHSLLSGSNPEDVTLRAILEQELVGSALADAVSLDGPVTVLNRRAAGSLGMALHELANNARNHGALRVSGGRVAVNWTLEQDENRLTIHWSETGGAKLTAPISPNFGLMLVRSAVEKGLGGSYQHAESDDGLSFVIALPLDAISAVT